MAGFANFVRRGGVLTEAQYDAVASGNTPSQIKASLLAGGKIRSSVAYRKPDANDYFFATLGMRSPNKEGSLSATFAYYSSRLSFTTGPWVIPAGTELLLAFPNYRNVEGNAGINEALIPQDVTIEAASVTYNDAGAVSRVAAATQFTNGGVLSSTVRDGGVIARIPLTQAIPARSTITIGVAIAGPSTMTMIGFYYLRSGEVARKHPSSSFATVVNSGLSPASNSGSSGASINGTQYGPAFVCAKGIDGAITPVVPLIDGDSIAYGKGANQLDDIIPNRVQGNVETGLARSASGVWDTTYANLTVAGSGFARTNASDPANYDPDIQKGRHSLISQVTALNGGKPPFNHIISQHGTNSIQSTAASQKSLIQSRYAWLRGMYPGMPITQLTMTQNVSASADGFRTVAGQTLGSVNTSTGTRFAFNDDLHATKLDGAVQFAVDVYSALAASEDRAKFKVHPYTATLTRATTSTLEVYVDNVADLVVGASLVIDPTGGNAQAFVVRSITEITAGSEYRVALDVGGSSASMPVGKAIGVAVAGAYPSDGDTDGNPGLGGLHRSYEADIITASWQGQSSWDQWKGDAKAVTLASVPV